MHTPPPAPADIAAHILFRVGRCRLNLTPLIHPGLTVVSFSFRGVHCRRLCTFSKGWSTSTASKSQPAVQYIDTCLFRRIAEATRSLPLAFCFPRQSGTGVSVTWDQRATGRQVYSLASTPPGRQPQRVPPFALRPPPTECLAALSPFLHG